MDAQQRPFRHKHETPKEHGAPCVNCGNTLRYVSNGQCVHCKCTKRASEKLLSTPCKTCGELDRDERGSCRPCKKKSYEAWRLTPERKIRQAASRYQTTVEDLRAIDARCEGKCELCREIKRLVYDHDHDTDKLRGKLCFRCNGMVGFLETSGMEVIARALKYISSGGPS